MEPGDELRSSLAAREALCVRLLRKILKRHAEERRPDWDHVLFSAEREKFLPALASAVRSGVPSARLHREMATLDGVLLSIHPFTRDLVGPRVPAPGVSP